jgi:hypothetical protein
MIDPTATLSLMVLIWDIILNSNIAPALTHIMALFGAIIFDHTVCKTI